MKRYAAVIISMTLALAATGLVSGIDSATTATETDSSVNNNEWSPSVENVVTRLVQNACRTREFAQLQPEPKMLLALKAIYLLSSTCNRS